MMAVESDAPVTLAVGLGAVPTLGKLMDSSDPLLFLESARILGNVAAASSEGVRQMVKAGMHQKLVAAIPQADMKQKEQVWSSSAKNDM